MSLYEYNEEKALKYIREGERELGFEEGMEKGKETGKYANLVQNIEQLMKSLKLNLAEACAAIGSSEQEYHNAKYYLEKNKIPQTFYSKND